MGYEIRGNHKISTDALLEVLKPYMRKRLFLNQLHEPLDLVAQRYKQAGVEARVYLPIQKITRPKMVIQIIELPSSGK